MDDNFPMFRWGGVIVLVIVLTAGAASLVERYVKDGPDNPPAREASKGGDKDDDDDKPAKAKKNGNGDASEAALVAALAGGAAQACRPAGETVALPLEVGESSGVAASRRTPGVFWTHNDSGDPDLFAVDARGALRGKVRVQGATVTDWEDIAAGPCAAGRCLYVGDIGDNEGQRAEIIVYRVAEPAPGDGRTAPAEALRARYPDGPHDAEALFVLPTGQVHVVTKGEKGHVAVYRFPAGAAPGAVATLERVRELSAGEVERPERITGASTSPDGRWLALRTLRSLSIYPTASFLARGQVAARTTDLRPLNEPQGEAVDFTSNGAVVLTSEGGKKGVPGTLNVLRCELGG